MEPERKEKMENEKISIVVPMYNTEEQINKSIDSLLRQSYTDFEIIIVNDGSTDNSLSLCRDTYGKNPNIKIIDKANGGVSDARNAGMRAASGKYITFVDADDWVESDYLSHLYDDLTQNGADISVADYKIETTDEKKTAKVQIEKSKLVSGSQVMESFFNVQISTAVWGKLYRRALIGSLQFPVGMKIGEDAFFVYHALRRAKTVSLRAEKLYHYWVDNVNSLTNNYFAKLDYDAAHFTTLIMEDVSENLPDMLPSACNFLMPQAMTALLNYVYAKKEAASRFDELSQTLQTIFQYAERTGKYYKYKILYLTHKICRPLGRALVAKWMGQKQAAGN